MAKIFECRRGHLQYETELGESRRCGSCGRDVALVADTEDHARVQQLTAERVQTISKLLNLEKRIATLEKVARVKIL